MARPTRARLRRDMRRPAQASRSTRRLPITGGDVRAAQLAGGDGLGDDYEAPTPEVFGTAGVLSRPNGGPEAIVVAVGGDGHDVVVATRDHAWAIAVGAANMPAGETWIFNSKAFVRVRANGDVEIGRPDGSFEEVATKSHRHAGGTLTNSGGTVTGFSGSAVAGTTGRGIASNLKAET